MTSIGRRRYGASFALLVMASFFVFVGVENALDRDVGRILLGFGSAAPLAWWGRLRWHRAAQQTQLPTSRVRGGIFLLLSGFCTLSALAIVAVEGEWLVATLPGTFALAFGCWGASLLPPRETNAGFPAAGTPGKMVDGWKPLPPPPGAAPGATAPPRSTAEPGLVPLELPRSDPR